MSPRTERGSTENSSPWRNVRAVALIHNAPLDVVQSYAGARRILDAILVAGSSVCFKKQNGSIESAFCLDGMSGMGRASATGDPLCPLNFQSVSNLILKSQGASPIYYRTIEILSAYFRFPLVCMKLES
jgi:hypothetical protein